MVRSPTCLALVLALGACAGGAPGGGDGGSPSGLDDAKVVTSLADDVIAPTYAHLERQAVGLDDAVDALAKTPDAAHLAAAESAWANAHGAWAAAEPFDLGPARTAGLAAAIDTWPVDVSGIDALLAGTTPLTEQSVQGLKTNLVGLHAMAYLLFGADGRNAPADLSPRALADLSALGAKLVADTQRLADAWGPGGSYRASFVGAGTKGDSAYPTRADAAAAVVEAMTGACDALAKTGIAAPYDLHDPTRVEGRFSGSAIDGFAASLTSMEDAYLGAGPDANAGGRFLTDWVAARDPSLEKALRSAFPAAIDAVNRIPRPFTAAVVDPADASVIETADAEVESLHGHLQSGLLPAVAGD